MPKQEMNDLFKFVNIKNIASAVPGAKGRFYSDITYYARGIDVYTSAADLAAFKKAMEAKVAALKKHLDTEIARKKKAEKESANNTKKAA